MDPIWWDHGVLQEVAELHSVEHVMLLYAYQVFSIVIVKLISMPPRASQLYPGIHLVSSPHARMHALQMVWFILCADSCQ